MPRIVRETSTFRVVLTDAGAYVFETPDGCDALGVEKWREVHIGGAANISTIFRDHIIDLIRAELKEERSAQNI